MKAILHARSGKVPSSETLTPSSHKQRPPRIPKENVEPNCLVPESSLFRSPPVSAKSPTVRNRSPLPPRPPPSSNPLKRKLNLETPPENGSPAALPCDSGVQVIVRVRPLNRKEVEEGSQIALKISHNSISILDHIFTFDSVADASSRQQDIFQLVGVPLVENCLAGFNSSIFAYGQTGSGKTYTMWGPCSALTADGSLSNESGLTPRVFELLFSRINEEQSKHSEKQLSYQCRCSFLEIYNEQITDLLDPTQRNLQIREDVRAGVYVDCLSEEYIYQMKDVIHLLVKGLSNRRTGATSINAESSRSHCVFTCVVECRSKSMDDGISSLRTSRINFVDLAGSERQKVTCAVGERLKEAGNINRSLSQLGNLINILAEVSQSGKHRHIPYRDSRLTFLLQDSLGGNAKLAMICAISPSQSCKTETFSTLRFAQGAKAIKNQAVVNETREDDVNFLREQIRQLKDELLRMKSNGPSPDSNRGSTSWNVQRSLNLLRLSLCRPRTLPIVEDDSDEEMEIVEEGVERTCGQAPLTINEESKNNTSEELSTLKNLKEFTPDHSDKGAIPSDMCPMEVVEKTCVEVSTIADNDNKKTSDKEPSTLKSLKELAQGGSDREAIPSDMCPMEVHASSIMSDLHVGLRIISMKGSEAEQTTIEKCRMNSQCGEEEMSIIQVSPIPNMKERISQEDCKQKMMHSMAEPFDDLGTEIFLEQSAVSGNSAGADVSDHDGIIQEGLKQEMVLDRAESTDGRVPEEADVSDRSYNCSRSQLSPCNLDIETCKTSLSLSFPTSNVSPRFASCSRKSLKRSSLMSASEGNLSLGLDSDLGVQNASLADNIKPSNSNAQSILPGTDSLADNIKNSNSNAQFFLPINNSSVITKNLEASLSQGLQMIDSHQHTSSLRNSLFRSSLRPVDVTLLISKNKVDAGVQTISGDSKSVVDSSAFICSCCHKKAPPVHCNNSTELAGLEIVHMDDYPSAGTSQSAERYKKLVPKAVEKVLVGSIRREMALEDHCAKQAAEINHLNRLVQQYKHERECTAIIELTREDKISRLEALMDGIIPSEDFIQEEFVSLKNEHMILKEKFENHPDVLRLNIELKRVQNELDGYRNFFDMGERDVLMEEIQDLRCQLQYFIDSSSMSTCGKNPVLPFTHSTVPILSPLVMIPETSEEIAHENLEQQRHYWSERESRWIDLTDGLRREIKASQSLADRLRIELESEKKCTEELKEALQTALEVHTRTLEQHAELEEKHIALLGRHRKMREGIADVKNAAARAGLKGAESKFIESLAAQIEALRAEREKERRFWRNENIGLQKQLRDTTEAVEAAGELLGRLKEAEECAATAKKRAVAAEKRTEKAYREINDLKKNYETEIATLNQLLTESRSLKVPEDEQPAGHPWFYGYDRCNI